MTAIGLGDIAEFPFIDPPDARNIADGLPLLAELGAFKDGHLTGLGASWPGCRSTRGSAG